MLFPRFQTDVGVGLDPCMVRLGEGGIQPVVCQMDVGAGVQIGNSIRGIAVFVVMVFRLRRQPWGDGLLIGKGGVVVL